MIDVLVVGAGPAGAVAATVLARAGARVMMIDRATFPREKLCGDTINPGTLAALDRLGLSEAAQARGVRVDGMIVSGEGGVTIVGRYPNGLHGRAITRAAFDAALVREAVSAGVAFEPATSARGPLASESDGRRFVRGVTIASRSGRDLTLDAPVTIAADGRRSTIAFALGLARHPVTPRRWAIGAYFEGVDPHEAGAAFGEMHVRRGRYVGIAPLGGGITNVCLVTPSHAGDASLRNPLPALLAAIHEDRLLAGRFRGARAIAPPTVLGPLAVESVGAGADGLLLAGDAAGFVDPMTGDGLRFAVRGGELAARAALRALEHGWSGVHAELARARRREFQGKWRFNRALRSLVSSSAAVGAAAAAARFTPALVRAIVARAGDCDRAA